MATVIGRIAVSPAAWKPAKCLLEEPLEPIGVEPDAAGERVKAVFGHKLECGVPHVYVYQLSERYINAQMVNDQSVGFGTGLFLFVS